MDSYQELVENFSWQVPSELVQTGPDEPALLVYTSGTTGNPKGALHAHRVPLGHLPGVELSHDVFSRPGDFCWTPADWAWIGGFLDVLLPAWHHGVPALAHPISKFDPGFALRLIPGHGCAMPCCRPRH